MSSSLGRNGTTLTSRNNSSLTAGPATTSFMPMSGYPDAAFTLQPNIVNATTASGTNSSTALLSVGNGDDTTNGTNNASRYSLTQQQSSQSSSSAIYGNQLPPPQPLPPQHPLTLHPPLHSGVAATNGLPFGSNAGITATSAAAAAVAAAAVSATGMSGNATNYFAMPSAWGLQWPTGASGAPSGVVPNGTATLAGLMGAAPGWTATGTQRPRLTTTLWEDESTICYQVDAETVCVARRQDNNMINGTKLLNVVGMTRGKRDGILKNEKQRVVVKVGAMHLKGVWIPFERAKILAEQHGILDKLYPLFAEDPTPHLLQHPPATATTRLRSDGSIQTLTATGYDLALMGGVGATRRRPPMTAPFAQPSPGYAHSVGGLDHLGMMDPSLLMEQQRSLAQPRGPIATAHSRKTSQTYGYSYGGSTDATGATVSNGGVTSVIGAGGSPAAWSPITPSMDPRPYYPSDVIYQQQPTSPSAVIYTNGNKKRSSDYLLGAGSGGQSLPGNGSSTLENDLYNVNYSAIAGSPPLAMQMPPRTNHTGAGSQSLSASSQGPPSSSCSFNTYPSVPLSPINSPSSTTFDGQPIERQYSEADDRPNRKRSRVGGIVTSSASHTASTNPLKTSPPLHSTHPVSDAYGGGGALPAPGLDTFGQRSSGFVSGNSQPRDGRDASEFPLAKYFHSGLDRTVSGEQEKSTAATTGNNGHLLGEEVTTAEASW